MTSRPGDGGVLVPKRVYPPPPTHTGRWLRVPVQTSVGDRLHGVEVAVRPVDPLGDDVHRDPRGNAQAALHQL